MRDLPAYSGRHPSRRGDQEGRRVMKTLVSRREILKGGLAVGAGLTVGFSLPIRAVGQTPGVFAPNQWLRIDRDGVVTITNSVPEMGQGSLTTTPMIIADELDAKLDSVKVEQAPANPALYKNPVTGNQLYGGSRGGGGHNQRWGGGRRPPPPGGPPGPGGRGGGGGGGRRARGGGAVRS